MIRHIGRHLECQCNEYKLVMGYLGGMQVVEALWGLSGTRSMAVLRSLHSRYTESSYIGSCIE